MHDNVLRLEPRRHPARRAVDLAHEPAFSLGTLEIVPAHREVIATEGQRQILEPRVMQVLVALAREDGGIVTRDDLIWSCWGGTVVGEDSITRTISILRRLSEGLGEGAFRIETITKVGYRLLAGAQQVAVEGHPLPDEPAAPPFAEPKPQGRRAVRTRFRL